MNPAFERDRLKIILLSASEDDCSFDGKHSGCRFPADAF
jgi:hypothetical protein